VNALDMVSGFTASAGPIGGADTSSAAGDGASAFGGFDALIAQALGDAAGDTETDPAETGTDDGEGADATDLSLLIAMAGGVSIPAFVAPVVIDLPPPPGDSLTVAAGDAGTNESSGAVGPTLNTLPCTVVSAGTDVAFDGDAASDAQSVVEPTPVALPVTAATGTARAVEPPAPPVVAAAESAAESAATVSPQMTTTLPAVSKPDAGTAAVELQPSTSATPTASTPSATTPAEVATPIQSGDVAPDAPAVQSTPAASAPVAPNAPHTESTLRAALERAGRQARAAAAATESDSARAQAVSELRSALEANRSGADLATTTVAPAPVDAVATAVGRSVDQPRAQSRTSQSSAITETLAGMAGAVVATQAHGGASGEGASRDGSNARGQAFAGIETVAASPARAEGVAQVFSFAADLSGSLSAVGRDTAVPAGPDTAVVDVTPQEHAQNVHSIVRSMRMHFIDGGGEARLQLNPEHLGQVTLTVKVEQGSVAAHIQAETADARNWIESNQQELRTALEEQGLDVTELVVTTDPDRRREREQPRDPFKPRPRRRDQDETAPKFEVIA
jgi:flagellar hook-length control protein FliK